MNNADIVLIAGSPSAQSRSARVLGALAERWSAQGLTTQQFGVGDFAAEDLLLARTTAPSIATFVSSVQAARALVLATPVYKAVYSGVLKTIVDLIPPDAVRGKVALGVATGRMDTHAPNVTAAYADLFGFFNVRVALPTLYLLDGQLEVQEERLRLDPAARARADASALALASALRESA